MSIFEKRIKSAGDSIPVTKEPNREILAVWYNIRPRALRDRFQKQSLSIHNRVLTEADIGLIFFKLGIPCKLPDELREWAGVLVDDYRRLVPLSAI
jgi:hypothetical protein